MSSDRVSLRGKVSALVLAAAVLSASAAWAQPLQQSPTTNTTPFCGVPGGGPDGGLPVEGLPASYTLQPNNVTSVKNQGQCGSCWSFATYGSMESNVLMQGGPARDLSENHLKNTHGFDWGPCAGGNMNISVAYLSRLDGPVDESDDPYHDWDDRPSPGGPRQYTLRSCLWHDTPTEMKNAVMSGGGLYVTLYWNSAYYNAGDATYYYNGGSTNGNHAVTLAGWDDNKVVSGAPTPGAWLCKNSWGTGFGQSGYFWISYHDDVACQYGGTFQADDVSAVVDEFGHDDFGFVDSVNCSYGLNVYQTSQAEEIGSVGFYTLADGAGYDVRIYDTAAGGAPSDLLAQKTGTIATQGFHLIDLDSTVSLAANDDFAVYLHITNGGSYPHAFDYAYPGYSSACTANPGESYYSFDGAGWSDLWGWNNTANFCIKAYTVPEPATMSLLALAGVALLRRRRNR